GREADMADGSRFDDLSKALASGMPRRRVLKLALAGVVGGAAAAVLGPSRSAEATVCMTTSCPPPNECCGTVCCLSPQICVDAATETCGCQIDQTVCGSICCPRSTVCLNASTGQCGCATGVPTCGQFCC